MNSRLSSCHAGMISEEDTERHIFLQNDTWRITRIPRHVPPIWSAVRAPVQNTKTYTDLHDTLWAWHWSQYCEAYSPVSEMTATRFSSLIRERNICIFHVCKSHPSFYSICPTSARVQRPETQSEHSFNSNVKLQNIWSFTFTPSICSVDRLCGQSSWLQIQSSRVRFPALTNFLRISGSGTGSTQPHQNNWGATWKKSSGSGLENRN
jgi:hypothetical protein